MALFLTSNPTCLSQNPSKYQSSPHLRSPIPFLSFPLQFYRFPSLEAIRSTKARSFPEENASDSETSSDAEDFPVAAAAAGIPDEWGEKAEPGPEASAVADPALDDDEWGKDEGKAEYYYEGNGSATEHEDEIGDLKRCLVDSFYGTEFGLRASAEVRAEVSELVSQLEVKNPTPAPTEAMELFDGNWVLLYTSCSELLPLIAVGSSSFLKVKKIYQVVDAKNLCISNVVKLSNPISTFSFTASASFEVRSPSRIQVRFEEGIFEPPEISSTINLPENIDVFGQKIDLLPVQGILNPVQQAAASITSAISGQPPLKVPIPGERSSSWLLTTFLDKDLRISRGDGGLFVLVKEGSPLLDQAY